MTIYIVDLESVETRYTCEWKQHFPKLLSEKLNLPIVQIEGLEDIPAATTPGAFLNFGGTNIYKSSQMVKLSELFTNDVIQDGDHIIFTDAWHPGIIQTKYMVELLKKNVKIHGFWHAGSYDDNDFLGRLIKDKRWSKSFERSIFYALDYNWFATQYHIELFYDNLAIGYNDPGLCLEPSKFFRTGWPMEYMKSMLTLYATLEKKNIILFPHRIAPEKQPEIFRDLAKDERLSKYEFIICQEKQLTKHEYHILLGQSKMVFSANLQETLGISMYEGILVNSIPLVPDRLSYSEMFEEAYKYPSEWTESFESYLEHKDELIGSMLGLLEISSLTSYDSQIKKLTDNFFSMSSLIETIKNDTTKK